MQITKHTTNLTLRRVQALAPSPGAQYVAWDADVKGFGVRVSPAGATTYILKFRLKSGRVRWKTIGRVGVLTLDAARDQARQDRGTVAAGLDPLQQIDASKRALTLAAVAELFLEEHVAHKKPATVRLYELALRSHVLPLLGAIPIAEVGDEDVLRLHHRVRGKPYMANRCLAVLSKLLLE